MPDSNTYRIEGDVVFVDVSTKSYPDAVVTIDLVDLPLVTDGLGRWVAARVRARGNKLYCIRGTGGRKNRIMQSMHRILLGLTDPTVMGDHRDGNGLNNRRHNLRPSTNQQNSQNGVAHCDSTSQYRGVSWDSERGKWTAGIGIDGSRRSLGRFDQEIDAALAYDVAAQAEFGEFARLNFPRES